MGMGWLSWLNGGKTAADKQNELARQQHGDKVAQQRTSAGALKGALRTDAQAQMLGRKGADYTGITKRVNAQLRKKPSWLEAATASASGATEAKARFIEHQVERAKEGKDAGVLATAADPDAWLGDKGSRASTSALLGGAEATASSLMPFNPVVGIANAQRTTGDLIGRMAGRGDIATRGIGVLERQVQRGLTKDAVQHAVARGADPAAVREIMQMDTDALGLGGGRVIAPSYYDVDKMQHEAAQKYGIGVDPVFDLSLTTVGDKLPIAKQTVEAMTPRASDPGIVRGMKHVASPVRQSAAFVAGLSPASVGGFGFDAGTDPKSYVDFGENATARAMTNSTLRELAEKGLGAAVDKAAVAVADAAAEKVGTRLARKAEASTASSLLKGRTWLDFGEPGLHAYAQRIGKSVPLILERLPREVLEHEATISPDLAEEIGKVIAKADTKGVDVALAKSTPLGKKIVDRIGLRVDAVTSGMAHQALGVADGVRLTVPFTDKTILSVAKGRGTRAAENIGLPELRNAEAASRQATRGWVEKGLRAEIPGPNLTVQQMLGKVSTGAQRWRISPAETQALKAAEESKRTLMRSGTREAGERLQAIQDVGGLTEADRAAMMKVDRSPISEEQSNVWQQAMREDADSPASVLGGSTRMVPETVEAGPVRFEQGTATRIESVNRPEVPYEQRIAERGAAIADKRAHDLEVMADSYEQGTPQKWGYPALGTEKVVTKRKADSLAVAVEKAAKQQVVDSHMGSGTLLGSAIDYIRRNGGIFEPATTLEIASRKTRASEEFERAFGWLRQQRFSKGEGVSVLSRRNVESARGTTPERLFAHLQDELGFKPEEGGDWYTTLEAAYHSFARDLSNFGGDDWMSVVRSDPTAARQMLVDYSERAAGRPRLRSLADRALEAMDALYPAGDALPLRERAAALRSFAEEIRSGKHASTVQQLATKYGEARTAMQIPPDEVLHDTIAQMTDAGEAVPKAWSERAAVLDAQTSARGASGTADLDAMFGAADNAPQQGDAALGGMFAQPTEPVRARDEFDDFVDYARSHAERQVAEGKMTREQADAAIQQSEAHAAAIRAEAMHSDIPVANHGDISPDAFEPTRAGRTQFTDPMAHQFTQDWLAGVKREVAEGYDAESVWRQVKSAYEGDEKGARRAFKYVLARLDEMGVQFPSARKFEYRYNEPTFTPVRDRMPVMRLKKITQTVQDVGATREQLVGKYAEGAVPTPEQVDRSLYALLGYKAAPAEVRAEALARAEKQGITAPHQIEGLLNGLVGEYERVYQEGVKRGLRDPNLKIGDMATIFEQVPGDPAVVRGIYQTWRLKQQAHSSLGAIAMQMDPAEMEAVGKIPLVGKPLRGALENAADKQFTHRGVVQAHVPTVATSDSTDMLSEMARSSPTWEAYNRAVGGNAEPDAILAAADYMSEALRAIAGHDYARQTVEGFGVRLSPGGHILSRDMRAYELSKGQLREIAPHAATGAFEVGAGKEVYVLPASIGEFATARGSIFTGRPEERALYKLASYPTNMFKLYAAPLNPRFHERNYIGGKWQLFLKDGPAAFSYPADREATRIALGGTDPAMRATQWFDKNGAPRTVITSDGTIYTYEQVWQRMEQQGLADTGFYTADLTSHLRNSLRGGSVAAESGGAAHPLLDAVLSGDKARAKRAWGYGWETGKYNPASQNFGVYETARKFGGMVEAQQRAQGFVHDLVRTNDPVAAAINTKRFLFDYGDNTELVGTWGKVLFPFIAWRKNNLPLQFVEMFKHPGRFSAFGHAKDLIESTSPQPVGERLGLMPEYLSEAGAVRMPATDENGKPEYWMQPFPITELSAAPASLSGFWPTARDQWLSTINPHAALLAELPMGTSLQGRPIKDKFWYSVGRTAPLEQSVMRAVAPQYAEKVGYGNADLAPYAGSSWLTGFRTTPVDYEQQAASYLRSREQAMYPELKEARPQAGYHEKVYIRVKKK